MASQGNRYVSISLENSGAFEGAPLKARLQSSHFDGKLVTATIEAAIRDGAGETKLHRFDVTIPLSSLSAVFEVPTFDDAVVGSGFASVAIVAVVNAELYPQMAPTYFQVEVSNNDFSAAGLKAGAETAWRAITRLAISPTDLSAELATLSTPRQVARQIGLHAEDTTAVAVTAYQFFSGKSPGLAGIDYLVNSPVNANDLNDRAGMYASFSLENRYINFAANLAFGTETAQGFAAGYSNLSFAQAVDKAYDTIIGKSQALAAGVDPAAAIADITARKGYFDALAKERMAANDADLAAKAGLVGYILAEAVKANVGLYARSLENFYLDLADGGGHAWVDLVGVYGPGSPLDSIS